MEKDEVVVWRMCPECLGQRRILEPVLRPNGEPIGVLGAVPCRRCCGVGQVTYLTPAGDGCMLPEQ